jgi:protein gp37
MAENSKIEWTHHTANLWWGCTRVHKGCDNCYAANLAKRYGKDLWDNRNRQHIKSTWGNLGKWNSAAEKAGEYHRVFVGSMMDIFEKPMPLYKASGEPIMYFEDAPATTDWSRSSFFHDHVEQNPNLIFLLLTKRPSNINKYIPEAWKDNPPANVMYGASVVDQQSANDVARAFSKVNGSKFLSVEPLLEEIDMAPFATWYDGLIPNIDWVIVGGESGPSKRPFNPDWARKIRDWCGPDNAWHSDGMEVPFFMKQWDKVKAVPDDLMIRQFPEYHLNPHQLQLTTQD